jgi:hypothetical protein
MLWRMWSLVADWMVSSFIKRSVLEVLSQMEHGSCDDSSNIFYSMIGAIITAQIKPVY